VNVVQQRIEQAIRDSMTCNTNDVVILERIGTRDWEDLVNGLQEQAMDWSRFIDHCDAIKGAVVEVRYYTGARQDGLSDECKVWNIAVYGLEASATSASMRTVKCSMRPGKSTCAMRKTIDDA
jgi:hypothetical protein